MIISADHKRLTRILTDYFTRIPGSAPLSGVSK